MGPEDREKWDLLLTAPLPGMEKAGASDAEAESEGAAFMALMTAEAQRKEQADARNSRPG
jgi:hypothetical protein